MADVENQLVDLVKLAAEVESITGLDPEKEQKEAEATRKDIRGEGPQIHAEERTDVVHSQDEVDDLLSSLGF